MSKRQNKDIQALLPTAEQIAEEMSKMTSIEDYFGKDGLFGRMFGKSIEAMLEAEMTNHLGYPKHSSSGDGSGNNRNGTYKRKLKSSAGETEVSVPRDRNGKFEPQLLHKYATSSNEIEDKVVGMYARGMTVADIQEQLADMYGIDVSDVLVSQMTNKVMPLVEEWRERPLDSIYTVTFLDCIHIRIRKDGRVQNLPVYIVIGVDLDGKKDVLGHYVGDSAEGSSFWLSVITDLNHRGIQDILIASVDGLNGFKEAINSVFPQTIVQRCVVHLIRDSLRHVSWKDKKEFAKDIKAIYKATNSDTALKVLKELKSKWGKKYAIAVRKWENAWDDFTPYFKYTPEIRRLIYTTNIIESYNRQLRKVIKTKSVFPNDDAVYKMLFLATTNITKKWTMPIRNWANIINQLAIHFEGRLPM